jgi:hypothetical protein
MTKETLQPDKGNTAPYRPEMPFRTLLYRFMFFDWLFRDVSAARDLFERHAALQHNKYMSRFISAAGLYWPPSISASASCSSASCKPLCCRPVFSPGHA